jgi:hypothetical protein
LILKLIPPKYFTFYSVFDESMFERVCMIYIYINLFFFFLFFRNWQKWTEVNMFLHLCGFVF